MIGYTEILTIVRDQLKLFDGDLKSCNVKSCVNKACIAGMNFIKESELTLEQKNYLEEVARIQIMSFLDKYGSGMIEDSSK
jgi:hypothetical protein